MSYGIRARVVNIEALEGFFGSGNESSLNRVSGWLKNVFPHLDAELPDAPPAYELLRALVMDPDYRNTQDAWTPQHSAKAIRLLEAITGWFGDPDPQPNRSWSAMNYGWFGAVDEALTAAGSDARASELLEPHSVAGLAAPIEFPIIHVMTAERAREWLAKTKDLDLSRTPAPERAAIEEMRDWMDYTVDCAEHYPASPGNSLLSFYF
ncbi:hypothetical protein AADG42_17695 [Ammonicoccus fulvus]|uniref:DUF7691 domain-containing protein n=1 Tax=Ammonicoccus fulvus TaxID=3138240 RepID=A0ABZ3FVI1_9ACTN